MTPRKKQKLFTISFRCGRLANRIMLFANYVALAEEQRDRLINFTFHSYSEFFEGTRGNVCCRYPRPKRRSWMDVVPGVAAFLRKTRIPYHLTRAVAALNESYPIFGNAVITHHELPGKKITVLDGPEYQQKIQPAKIVFVYGWWLRTPNLVKKHAEKIRVYFRPVEKFETASRNAIGPLRREADVVIGVHIRQGDYRGWFDGKYFFPVARYAAWMHELAAQFPDRRVAFFVCSDEPRSLGEFPGLNVGLGTDSPVSDVYALARCDYILGTKSTFTQWASFYGEKPLLQVCDTNEPAKLENFRVSYLDWD
jgi:Glycosyl transferase family 11